MLRFVFFVLSLLSVCYPTTAQDMPLSQVLIEGEGWKHVDPTAASGCGSDYISFVSSEDGEIPMLYTSSVKIEVVSTSNKRNESAKSLE